MDGSIRCWDLDKAEGETCVGAIKSDTGHTAAVLCLNKFQFEDNEYIVSGGADGVVAIWSVNGEPIACAREESEVTSLQPFTDADGMIYVHIYIPLLYLAIAVF
jgi:WD40 repeat protein